ncbi:MAG: SgcJ/EcaC family oxidoreductase [Flavobacteriales bacterium]|nr:SgcJ/EcaC family oxidoreductase [Flavobacteriales bacterium]
MKTITTSLIVLSFLFTACNEKVEVKSNSHLNTQKMEKQEKEQIEQLLMTYKESLNTSDAGKAVSLYTKQGVFMPSEAPSAIGSTNIEATYEYVFSQIQLNIEFYIEEILVESDVAFATTTSKGTTLIHATGDRVPEENRELFVFEKENGEWKIARYMFNKMSPKS